MKEKGKKEKKLGSVQRTILIIVCIILAIILLFLLVVSAFIGRYLGLIQHAETQPTLSSAQIESLINETDAFTPGDVIDPTDVTWSTLPSDYTVPAIQDNIINILLIGQDRRAGQGRQRSDAMILCTINKSAKTVTMTSFLRDLYVPIPGYQDNRLNACYVLGGMELLDNCLEQNFGVKIDGNVEVDFEGFMKAIDLLGGVDIELTSAEANYLNKNGNWEVTHEAPWNLTKGMNHLTGSQALAYSRIRYIDVDGDFSRTNRQRKVLSALLNKCKNLSFSQLDELLVTILPLVTTDLSDKQIMAYAAELIPLLPNVKVINQRVPADGTFQNASIRGMAVLVPDLDANRALVAQILSGEIEGS